MSESITLLELNKKVQSALKIQFNQPYWVIGEISELKTNRTGHAYIDLVEKDELEDKIIAKARAIIWANTYRILKPYFETTTKKEFESGLKILIKTTVEFHELYGYSLYIHDIDPTYTLGELARKKLETIERLKQEGIFNMNKELDFPLAPQKIAVISSQTAAGYKDFMEQLHNNPYQYKFYTKLFPTLLQGEHAEKSIINALEKIFNHENFFDLVVIIRGGGAKSDLGIFDLYELAANIAQYPLPVITGIGHEQDESIADLVAFQKLKTPTAVADFLVEKLYNFESLLFEKSDYLKSLTDQYIKQENLKLQSLIYRLIPKTRTHLESEKSHLFQMSQKLKNSSNQIITNQKYKIHNYASNVKTSTALTLNKEDNYLNKHSSEIINLVRKTITNHKNRINTFELSRKYLDPKEIIKRGYSITMKNGKIIKSSENVEKDDHIKTILKKGEIESKVTGINNDNQ